MVARSDHTGRWYAVSLGRRGVRAPRRARRATRCGAVPPMTSHEARAPSIEAADRSSSPRPGSAASAAAVGSSLAPIACLTIVVRDLVEAETGRLGLGHERTDDVVGGTERDAATDQGVRHGGRGRVALARGRAHPARVDRRASRPARPSPGARSRTPRRRRTTARPRLADRAGRRAAGP